MTQDRLEETLDIRRRATSWPPLTPLLILPRLREFPLREGSTPPKLNSFAFTAVFSVDFVRYRTIVAAWPGHSKHFPKFLKTVARPQNPI
jgi:hypothetical protein